MLPSFPLWARPGPDAVPGAAEFQAGAGLALVGAALAAGAVHGGVWLDRLALRAAAAEMVLTGRAEDEPDIRDACHLTRPGHDSGPAGRAFAAWRGLARRSPPAGPGALEDIARSFAPRAPAGLGGAAWAVCVERLAPLAAVAGVAAAVARLAPGHPALPLALADATLARRLGWPVVVPLLAGGFGRRAPRPEGEGWRNALAEAYAGAAAAACDRFADLGRRAAVLEAVEGRLRAKPAAEVVARLLAEDSICPSRAAPDLSDRAGRRLCDRLVALGAVRELTGRASFRLYGL